MVYSIKVKESYNDKDAIYEERFDSPKDYCQSSLFNFQSKKTKGFFSALLIPVRTHNLKDFCKDLFFPTFFNDALKVHGLVVRIFASMIAICIDIASLTLRLITAIPRYYQNREQTRENHPLLQYLMQKGVDPLMLNKDYVYLQKSATNTDGSLFIQYPTVNFIDLPESATSKNESVKLFADVSNKQLEMLSLSRPSGSTMTIEVIEEGESDDLIIPDATRFSSAYKEEVIALQKQVQNTNPIHPILNLNELGEFLPKHKLQMGEVTYYTSKPFCVARDNMGVIALVQMHGKVFPRIFYRSNSQAIWRVMPSATKQESEPVILRLGKGMAESDTQLPIRLNLALQKIMPEASPESFLMASNLVETAYNYTESYAGQIQLEDFATIPEGEPKIFIKKGMFVPKPPNPRVIEMPVKEGSQVHFQKCLLTTEFDDPHYGKIIAKIFPSIDQHLQYLFYEASDSKVFLAGVELVEDNEINSFGVRTKALNTNGLDSSLLEYYSQIPSNYEPSYGAPTYLSNRYHNNWNFVRELSIIKAYYSEQGREIPAVL